MIAKAEWIAAAKIELKGKDPFESLSILWENFTILPYYNQSDLSFNTETIAKKKSTTLGGPNNWFNLPEADASSAELAISIAMDHLLNGADGVFFKISPQYRAEKLLRDIKPEFCFIAFEADSQSIGFLEELTSIVNPGILNGCVFWNRVNNWLPVANLFKGYSSFRCLGITEQGESEADKLFNSIAEALKVADLLTDYAFPAQQVFNQLAFSVSASNNFFADIVKVRALRLLVHRLANAYGLESSNSFIRVKVQPSVQESYQPHGDFLGNSFAAIAAVSSSADAVTIVSENHQSELHLRTARNISLLLREESRMDKVIDPLAGSYFIESLTSAMVEKVWIKLTTKA